MTEVFNVKEGTIKTGAPSNEWLSNLNTDNKTALSTRSTNDILGSTVKSNDKANQNATTGAQTAN